jgi:hypothetical protein
MGARLKDGPDAKLAAQLNGDDRVNALSSPSRRCSKSRGTNALAAVCGNGRPHLLGKDLY